LDWTADREAIEWQLLRLVALMLGLAALADRACSAEQPQRRLVMSLLRPAEAVALDFVFGGGAVASTFECAETGAAQLAARFRALAWALAGLVARMGGCRRAVASFIPSDAGNDYVLGREGVATRRCPFDTS